MKHFLLISMILLALVSPALAGQTKIADINLPNWPASQRMIWEQTQPGPTWDARLMAWKVTFWLSDAANSNSAGGLTIPASLCFLPDVRNNAYTEVSYGKTVESYTEASGNILPAQIKKGNSPLVYGFQKLNFRKPFAENLKKINDSTSSRDEEKLKYTTLIRKSVPNCAPKARVVR